MVGRLSFSTTSAGTPSRIMNIAFGSVCAGGEVVQQNKVHPIINMNPVKTTRLKFFIMSKINLPVIDDKKWSILKVNNLRIDREYIFMLRDQRKRTPA
jgi:hypothetical protein